MTGETERYLAVGAALFVLGAIGFLTRRNLILLVLSAEMMLHGVGLTLITFSRVHHTYEGHVFTIFSLTVAACEAALALALILALYRQTHSLDVDLWSSLHETDLLDPVPQEPSARVVETADTTSPTLTPAGHRPDVRSLPVPVTPAEELETKLFTQEPATTGKSR